MLKSSVNIVDFSNIVSVITVFSKVREEAVAQRIFG